jgi:hypothetical protein
MILEMIRRSYVKKNIKTTEKNMQKPWQDTKREHKNLD